MKISEAAKNRVWQKGYKHTEETKEANRWRQILRHQPDFPFSSYEEFKKDVIENHERTRLSAYSLASSYGVNGSTIQKIIGISEDVSWSKILKTRPDFPYKTYDSFKKAVLDRHNETGLGPENLATFFNVNYTTIKRIIGNTTDKNSVAWTRIRGRLPEFPFSTYEEFSKYCYDQKLSGRKVYKIAQELNIAQGTVDTAVIRWKEANSY